MYETKSADPLLRTHGTMESIGLPLVYRGLIPDFLIRAGIRSMLSSMVSAQDAPAFAERVAAAMAVAGAMPLIPLDLSLGRPYYTQHAGDSPQIVCCVPSV